MSTQSKRTAAFALCGSFCSFSAVLPQMRALVDRGWELLPIVSISAATQDTRFGTAAALRQTLYETTGHTPLTTLQAVEPLGPQRLAEALIIAPATGNVGRQKPAARRAACHCCALYQRWPFRQRPGTGPAFAAAALLFCALRAG